MMLSKKEFKVHFIGIGGVSMMGLAEYFKSVGFTVSGSDRAPFNAIEKLNKMGITVYLGHSKKNVEDCQVVVYSDAIGSDNAELARARELGLYVLSRAEALNTVAENFSDVVGVCGCHGKTTVTCMLAHIFSCAKISFTAHIGGSDVKFGNFIMQGNDVFLSEVCEFKQNINKFNADYAVCLNVGKDHMDCYGSENELYNAYASFAKRAYKSVINKKDKYLSSLNLNNSIGFSDSGEGEFSAKNIRSKKGRYSFDLYKNKELKAKIKLSVYGHHNVENALAAASCALCMGIDSIHVKKGLNSFIGVARRFERIGKIGGAEVIADYAHHPTEIEACFKAAREISRGEIYVVFQPHTYTRTLYLKSEFLSVLSKIENLSLFKTFSARESYQKGGGAYDLHLLLDKSQYFEDLPAMLCYYKSKLKRKDILLVLGAGDLYGIVKNHLNNRPIE